MNIKKGKFLFDPNGLIPMGTQRNNNAIMTSKRRRDAASTPPLRRVSAGIW